MLQFNLKNCLTVGPTRPEIRVSVMEKELRWLEQHFAIVSNDVVNVKFCICRTTENDAAGMTDTVKDSKGAWNMLLNPNQDLLGTIFTIAHEFHHLKDLIRGDLTLSPDKKTMHFRGQDYTWPEIQKLRRKQGRECEPHEQEAYSQMYNVGRMFLDTLDRKTLLDIIVEQPMKNEHKEELGIIGLLSKILDERPSSVDQAIHGSELLGKELGTLISKMVEKKSEKRSTRPAE